MTRQKNGKLKRNNYISVNALNKAFNNLKQANKPSILPNLFRRYNPRTKQPIPPATAMPSREKERVQLTADDIAYYKEHGRLSSATKSRAIDKGYSFDVPITYSRLSVNTSIASLVLLKSVAPDVKTIF